MYTPPTTTLYLEGTTHTCNVQKKSLKFFLWKYLDLKNSWRNVYGSSNTNAIHGISEMFRHVLQKIVLATLLFISDLFIALSLVLDNTVAYTEFFYSFFSDVFELDAEIYGHFWFSLFTDQSFHFVSVHGFAGKYFQRVLWMIYATIRKNVKK